MGARLAYLPPTTALPLAICPLPRLFSGNAGNGGAISLTAANGINITGNLSSSSSSDSGNAGNGGAISLTAANDINITGNLSSFSSSEFWQCGEWGRD
jgi:hypothetical protein